MLSRASQQSFTRGFALVEFQVVALLGMFPLLLGALQVFLLLIASQVLHYATFEAARAGAVTGADPAAMRRALAIGLLPLHSAAAGDITPQNAVEVATAAYGRSVASNLVFASLQIVNPTAEAFADFATDGPSGFAIRNDSLESRPTTPGVHSGVSVQEANLLRIRARYCHPLQVPFIGSILIGVLRTLGSNPEGQVCYGAGRVPLVSEAVVNMQSDARFHAE